MTGVGAILVAAGLFVLLALAETQRPDRAAAYHRWPLNLSLGAAALFIGRSLASIGPLGASIWAADTGFGLIHAAALPAALAGLLTIILLDCAVYWQHRAFHQLNFFWRWHRLHHADLGLDLSTGLRFHPAEVLASLLWKSACVAALGAPVWAVPLFELWLMAGSLVEHSNIRLSGPLDTAVRRLLVTPAMHRVHHSRHQDDARHNYGFALAVWDHLFGTYMTTASGSQIGPPDEAA